MMEFKYATELVRAFSDDSRKGILKNLYCREMRLVSLRETTGLSPEEFAPQLTVLVHTGLVSVNARNGVEYAKINPAKGALVRNFLVNNGCF